MSEYGGAALVLCAILWLVLGGYSFGRAIASGDVKSEFVGSMMGFCIILGPFAFGYSLVADAHQKKKDTEPTT